MHVKSLSLVLPIVLGLSTAFASSLKSPYEQLRQVEIPQAGETDAHRLDRIKQAYSELYGVSVDNYQQLNSDKLHDLFEAASDVAFFDEHDSIVLDVRRYLEALEERRKASDADYAVFYDLLLVHRDFLQARALFATGKVRGRHAPPPVVQTDAIASPRVFEPNEGSENLTHVVLPETGIVVVGQPGCQYSVQAATAIHNSPVLAEIFRRHSMWIAPAQHALNASQFSEWNAKFPESKLGVAELNSEFPTIDHWATPTFYFFRSGKLVSELSGWSPTDATEKLAAGLAKIGFSAPVSPQDFGQNTTTVRNLRLTDPLQAQIDRGTAPIRSRADLLSYLQDTPANLSPLQAISDARRHVFLAELTFSNDGVTKIPLVSLSGLTETQAYRVLALFGWQSKLAAIPGLRVVTDTDRILADSASASRSSRN